MEIVGHRSQVSTLERAIALDTLPNALIITGPDGAGKTRLAREIARTLNCTADERPCGQCVHCRQIASSAHPDVIFIARREGKTAISIEQVRELREEAALRPYQARYKVYVVEGAETLTAQAADAMLKTLEEPPADLVLILTALDIAALPETVASRCRVVALSSVSESEIVAALRAEGAGDEDAIALARLAGGSVGWALRAYRTPKLRQDREILLERLQALPAMRLDERLDLAEKLAADRKDRAAPRIALETLLLIVRTQMLETVGTGSAAGLHDITTVLHDIRHAMDRLDSNVDARLTLEALFVTLP
ncbi:MAG TPA: DNA polymerase III subunit delta' [Chloroflexota bacterium]|nr:DNA polymerase III subunit delta' [Chloroflexota bacterium]